MEAKMTAVVFRRWRVANGSEFRVPPFNVGEGASVYEDFQRLAATAREEAGNV